MAEQFGRAAVVTIDTLELKGFDVSFKVKKSLKPEPNTCELAVYNLNSDHRSQLEQLRPKEKLATKGIPCRIEIGRTLDDLFLLWLGDLRTVDSQVDGPDWVTNLTSGDGEQAFQNARVHVSYGPKTPVETALRAIARALGVGEGNLGKVVSQLKINGSALLPQGATISGSASRHLDDFVRSADLEWSIQDGALQLLNRGKTLATRAIQLDAEHGLVGSPTVDNKGLFKARMLIQPDVRPGTLIVSNAERVKGNYRVEQATWDGDTAGGNWYIDVEASRY